MDDRKRRLRARLAHVGPERVAGAAAPARASSGKERTSGVKLSRRSVMCHRSGVAVQAPQSLAAAAAILTPWAS